MANSKPGSRPSGQAGQSGKAETSREQPTPAPRGKKPAAPSARPAAKPIARSSVAQARKQSSSNNRTQLIIGGIAVVLIATVIIVGLILNRQATAVQGEGYGPSTASVATLADGVVTVSVPGAADGTLTIDAFEDPLCPACAQFEAQFGQQINQAVDQGQLVVRYQMLNFLNPNSFSGDYSTRAIAATQCVAQQSGSTPGVYMNFRESLFAPGTQPAEGGSSDLTNQQLADLATTAGASQAAADCITAGSNVSAAQASATAANTALSTATGGQVGTPSVLKDGAPVQLSVDWLTNLLPAS